MLNILNFFILTELSVIPVMHPAQTIPNKTYPQGNEVSGTLDKDIRQ